MDVSKSELLEEIKKILSKSDLANTSIQKVLRELEKQYGKDIWQRKKEIDDMVMSCINSDEESAAEEEVKKPKATKASKKAMVEPEPKSDDDSDMEEDKPAIESDDDDDKVKNQRSSRSKRAAAKPKTKAEKKAGGGVAKRKGTGFTRSYKLSPALSELMGADEMPRHAVVKGVWALVKERQLYDPNNKQFAICDDDLFKVIGKRRFKVFGMMKYLKNHFLLD